MAKGLLIGNGINACMGIKDLSVACISERFRKNVKIYSEIIQNIFNVQIEENFFVNLERRTEQIGIETLAGILYKYIKEDKTGIWTDNDEYRIQDIIACICLTSIFFKEEGKISQKCELSKLPQMKEYEYIYTLNYIEFWDKGNTCIHLHGRIDLSKLNDKKNAMLVSEGRLNLDEYANAVERIKEANNIIEFSPNNIIFAPEGIEKQNLVCVSGLRPSNRLYPASDLFLYRPKKLYTELDNVDELDVLCRN